MGKGNKTQPFVFNLTAWYNLSPGCNMLGGSFKGYHRAHAKRPPLPPQVNSFLTCNSGAVSPFQS